MEIEAAKVIGAGLAVIGVFIKFTCDVFFLKHKKNFRESSSQDLKRANR